MKNTVNISVEDSIRLERQLQSLYSSIRRSWARRREREKARELREARDRQMEFAMFEG